MGVGRSKVAPLQHRSKYGIFVDRNLSDGARDLVNENDLRQTFVEFLKSGSWLDDIAHFVQSPVTLSHEERLAREKDCVIYEYKTDSISTIHAIVEKINSATMPTSQRAEALFNYTIAALSPRDKGPAATERRSSGPSKHSSLESLGDCYMSIDGFCQFSKDELVAILISSLYPIFITNPDRDGSSKESLLDLSIKRESCRPLTRSSKRAQSLFLACAANFDESVLAEHLQNSSWVHDLDCAFENHRLAISIIDTNRLQCPIIYVNAAFENMTGRRRKHIIGKRLNILNGPDTELSLVEHVNDALRNHLPCKVAITNYNKKGDRFTNFVAYRASGGYTFAVHCPSTNPTLLEDLKVILNEDVFFFFNIFI